MIVFSGTYWHSQAANSLIHRPGYKLIIRRYFPFLLRGVAAFHSLNAYGSRNVSRLAHYGTGWRRLAALRHRPRRKTGTDMDMSAPRRTTFPHGYTAASSSLLPVSRWPHRADNTARPHPCCRATCRFRVLMPHALPTLQDGRGLPTYPQPSHGRSCAFSRYSLPACGVIGGNIRQRAFGHNNMKMNALSWQLNVNNTAHENRILTAAGHRLPPPLNCNAAKQRYRNAHI